MPRRHRFPFPADHEVEKEKRKMCCRKTKSEAPKDLNAAPEADSSEETRKCMSNVKERPCVRKSPNPCRPSE